MNPFQPTSYAHVLLVEELMALRGRGEPDPLRVRRILETKSVEELSAARDRILDGE
jgi:hypothetical protein